MRPRESAPGVGWAAKVPEVTALFWVTKVLTTGMGETASDFLAHRLDPYVAVAIGGAGFALAMAIQFRARSFEAWKYWFAVVMVSVFGTMAADGLHVQLGVPYVASTTFYVVVLAAIFLTWRRVEGTLSIHSITTSRREVFYWATVLATFALGTAVGDLTAITAHWGYFTSGVVFGVAIAVPALLYWRFRYSSIAAFWICYVLTRPLGASFADWLGVSRARHGLGWGTGTVTIGLTVLIAALVGYSSTTTVPGDATAIATAEA